MWSTTGKPRAGVGRLGPRYGCAMAGFSNVDRSPCPEALVDFFDAAALGQSGIKHYVAAAHAVRRPLRPILDVGCGAGHDVVLLRSFGLSVVGIDPSAAMLEAARARGALGDTATLVRAMGESLPFAAGVFGGCRLERVLMHVVSPRAVVQEVCRCVESGGLVTMFEPDWLRFEVASDVLTKNAGWISGAAHPGIGGRLWELLEEAGCEVLDQVEELSVWRSLSTMERVAGFPACVERAVVAGRVTRGAAEEWIQEQRRRDADGRFEAVMPKVLIVAKSS